MTDDAAQTRGLAKGRVDWAWWQRAMFRFAFLFWGRFCLRSGILSQVFWWIPGLERWVLRWPEYLVSWPTDVLDSYFTTHIFHLTGEAATRHPSGSGDTAQDWVDMLALVVFAVAGSLVWTAISEWRGRRKEYRTLFAWLRLAMRLILASILLGYGFSKVFDLQFPPPTAGVLLEPYGQSSPMGLLWTFMGFSAPYVIFAGVAEAIAGVLLLFRRTSTLGALAACTVLLNIVMLNFCYDVPVKLYSTLYLLMALFLLVPDVGPMWRFFVLRRDSRIAGVSLLPAEPPGLRIAAYVLQLLVVGHILYASVNGGYKMWRKRAAPAAISAQAAGGMNGTGIDGSWIVDSSSGWPAGKEWKSVTIGRLRYQGVDFFETVRADGTQRNLSETMNWQHEIHFLDRDDNELHWSQAASGIATLEGTWLGQPAKLTMHRQPDEGFPLMTRGFHWVQELPYAR